MSLIAYIDPGSGTLALQAILACVIGGVFACRGFAAKVWATLVRGDKAAEPPTEGGLDGDLRGGDC